MNIARRSQSFGGEAVPLADIVCVMQDGLPYIFVDIVCKRLTPDDADVVANEIKRMAAVNRESVVARTYAEKT